MLTQNGSNVAGTPGRHMGASTALVLRSDVGDGGAFVLQFAGGLNPRSGWPDTAPETGWARPLKSRGGYVAGRAAGAGAATAVITTKTDIGTATAAGTSTATGNLVGVWALAISSDRTAVIPWENRTLTARGGRVLLYWPPKDPDETCDFSIDWAGRIGADTIQTAAWSVTGTGLTVATTGITGTVTSAWLTGGTLGTEYRVTCRITTTGGLTLDQTCVLQVRSS